MVSDTSAMAQSGSSLDVAISRSDPGNRCKMIGMQ